MTVTYPLTMPTMPDFTSIRVTARSVVAQSVSPFTLVTQKQVHQGDAWEFELSLPPMTRASAAAWQAFFLKLNGKEGSFYFGHATTMDPRGTANGTPLVDGAAQTGKTLNVRGWTDEAGVMLAGDYFQIGSGATSRLYMVTNDVNGGASPQGAVAMDIWPRLRESPADAAALVTASPVGVFELASNSMPWDILEAQLVGITFAIREAR